jgi:HK97 family phage major capsid protein
LTTDPTAAFRTEGSTVTASDPVFDQVVLDSKTLSALVIGSMEWFMDSPNVDEVVSEAIASAVALKLDQQALFGGVVAGGETGATGFNTTFPVPPNPRGLLAALLADASSSVLGSGANGTAQTALTYFNELITTIYTPMTFNETPTGILWNAKLSQQYQMGYDSTGQPLQLPASVASLPKFVTNQIPSFTQGTMTTRATDLFVGDWSQLLIGQRLDFTVQTLVERYAELGQIAIIAHWRGDVGVARPRAFAAYRYLQGAA